MTRRRYRWSLGSRESTSRRRAESEKCTPEDWGNGDAHASEKKTSYGEKMESLKLEREREREREREHI